MIFQSVCLETIAHVLPDRVVRSDELEQRLAPVYERLGRSIGRLELMTGVRERRFWTPGTTPSQAASLAGARAIEAAGIDRAAIGCVVNGSVSRDFLEPSTANLVHHNLDLSPSALVFDVTNACLGFLNGLVIVGNMIELGQIRAGLVVCAECAETLIESTIKFLLQDEPSNRRLKLAFASLTIGSGAAAAVLTHESLSRTGHRLLGGAFKAASEHHHLCQGGPAGAEDDDRLLTMETHAEELKAEGCELGRKTWTEARRELGWNNGDVDRVFCHQVGEAYRRLLLQTLDLSISKDFETLSFLGNTGSAALPLGLALGVKEGLLASGQTTALLGIGSGINCLILGLRW
jgi:3-oxoacyl-[acyl-carrier-protein] synthase III